MFIFNQSLFKKNKNKPENNKIVSCAGCVKPCYLRNQGGIKKMLGRFEEDGYDRVIVSCDFFKDYFLNLRANNNFNFSFAVGFKDEDGEIIDF